MQKFRRVSQGLAASSWIPLSIPLVLSGALRFFQLSRSGYWLDEMTSLDLVTQPGIRPAFSDNNPPLYHLILKLWVWIAGSSEWATRSLSVFFSVVATYFVMKAIEQLRGSRGAMILGGLLHAVCVLSLAYAREARMYSLFEMWMAISVYFFLRLYQGKSGIQGFVISCIGMTMTHYLGIIPVTMELALLVFGARTLTVPQRFELGGLLLILAGVQGQIYSVFFKWDGLDWQTMKTAAEPLALWPRDVLYELGNRSAICCAALTLMTFAGIAGALKGPRDERGQKLSLLALAVFPLLGLWGATLVSGRALLLPRYLVFLVPPCCVFWGFTRFTRKWVASALAGLFMVGTLAGLHNFYAQRREPWREVAAMIQKYPGSVVYTTRTVALRTPYFTRMGVAVKHLTLGDSGDLAELAADVARGKKVWILENFWGGYSYMADLKRVFNGMKFSVSDLSVRDEDSPPVVVMEVEAKHT